jgi:hypothetical protein
MSIVDLDLNVVVRRRRLFLSKTGDASTAFTSPPYYTADGSSDAPTGEAGRNLQIRLDQPSK